MDDDIDEFLVDFDNYSDDVSESKHEFFARNLRRWFDLIDTMPAVSGVIQKLENTVDYEKWDGLIAQRGRGHGRIDFPNERDERLGIQVALFRSLTKSDGAALNFAHQYVSSERNLNDKIADLVNQVFKPFARDLRRRLERHLRSMTTVPAADRIVTLDHNSPEYVAAVEAIDRLAEALRVANDYPDVADKDQKVAEIAAGRELVKAKRVNLNAVLEVLAKPVRDLIKKFYDQGLGQIAKSAWAALEKLLPSLTSLFDGS